MSTATRVVRSLAISAGIGLATVTGSAAIAAEGWTYKILCTGGCLGGANINNLGQVAFIREQAFSSPGGLPIYDQQIVVSDGTTEQVIYSRSGVEQVDRVRGTLSINDQGRVVLRRLSAPTGLYEVRDDELHVIPTPSGMALGSAASTAHMNSRGELALQGIVAAGGVNVQLSVTDGTNSISQVVPYLSSQGTPFTTAGINEASEAVGLSQNLTDNGTNVETRLAFITPTRMGWINLGAPVHPDQPLGDIGFNDLGVATYSPSFGGFGFSHRGIYAVDIRQPTPTVRQVFDPSTAVNGRNFIWTSINNLNNVLFGTEPTSSSFGLDIYDVDGQHLSIVARVGDVLVPGTTFAGGDPNNGPLNSRSLSSSGPLAFHVLANQGADVVPVIVRADPIPGLLPSHPLLPAPGDELPDGGWRFPSPPPFQVCRLETGSTTVCGPPIAYIDPPVAVGYRYEIEGDAPSFIGVQVPAPLPNGDAEFTVNFGDQSAQISAGEWFDLTQFLAGGVRAFTITGISMDEAIDPADATAFVTGLKLAFAVSPAAEFEIRMVPILSEQPDNTPPVVVPNVTGTQFNPPWYISDVQLTWSVSDPESEVTSTTGCGAVSLATDTAGTTYTCSATSAGGTTTESITLRRDTLSPAISFGTPSPLANASGWNRTDVNVPFSATDATSGVASLSPPISPIVVTGEGASLSSSVTATDHAGLENTASTPSFKIDRTNPSISIAVPASGDVYVQNQAVTASYACADGLSGIADGGCSGPVPSGSPVSTGTAGSFDFTVLARDRADNEFSRTHQYTVVASEPMACDADLDGDVDKLDLSLITAARNQPASGPADPRDADRDGVITQKDVNLCRSRCDQKGCK